MLKRIAGLLLVALFPLTSLAQEAPAAAPPAPAAVPAAASTVHRHLGFFIRLEPGLGYLSTSGSPGGADLEVSGGGGGFGLAIGGAVSEDFIIGGQVWDYLVMDPDVKVGGQSVSSSTDSGVALVGIGVLLNWYFMPGNWYVAVTPSLTQITIDDGFTSVDSDWGFGLRAGVGKEWWVSDHWGLGVSASLGFSSNKMADLIGSPTFNTFATSVNFSATYN